MRIRFRQMVFVVTAVFVLSGCAAFGHRRVSSDRFNYNDAIARSTRDQMLLNLVRLRYLEVPVFLTVSSVLTQYIYEGNVGVSGTANLGGPDLVGGNAGLAYSERPTITYLPLGGQEFAAQMLSKIPLEFFFAATQAGWPSDILMQIGIQRMGDVENMSFGAVPAPGEIDYVEQLKRDFEKLKRFQRALKLLMVLGDRETIEVHRVRKDDVDKRYLVFAEEVPKDLRAMIREIKKLLGLRPDLNIFRITERLTRLKDDEISIQTRSVMAMMSFLSRGIEVPPEQLAEGKVIDYRIQKAGEDEINPSIPFRMRAGKERPKGAFVAVRYQDHWFYIDDTDLTSKRVLGTMIILLRLQAPSPTAAAPVLTLPTGR